MLKHGVRSTDPGGGLLLAVWRQTEGMGVRGSVAENAPGGSVVCLGNEAPLLSGAQGVGPPLWTLSPHARP